MRDRDRDRDRDREYPKSKAVIQALLFLPSAFALHLIDARYKAAFLSGTHDVSRSEAVLRYTPQPDPRYRCAQNTSSQAINSACKEQEALRITSRPEALG